MEKRLNLSRKSLIKRETLNETKKSEFQPIPFFEILFELEEIILREKKHLVGFKVT